jgi:acetyl-CoA carboxylase alpha subunit
MAILPQKTAEKHLAHQLQIQAQTMAKRGIVADVIEEEIRALESVIRAELWYVVMTGGGAA